MVTYPANLIWSLKWPWHPKKKLKRREIVTTPLHAAPCAGKQNVANFDPWRSWNPSPEFSISNQTIDLFAHRRNGVDWSHTNPGLFLEEQVGILRPMESKMGLSWWEKTYLREIHRVPSRSSIRGMVITTWSKWAKTLVVLKALVFFLNGTQL